MVGVVIILASVYALENLETSNSGGTTTSTLTIGTTSLGTTTTGSTQTSATCTISAEGSGFYLTVTSDANEPIQGAQVSGTRVTVTNYGTCEQSIGTYRTNSTGSVLITPSIGSYYLLSIQYQEMNFTVKAPIEPMLTTYVVLKVPSGNTTVNEVAFGGCQRNANGTTCPG